MTHPLLRRLLCSMTVAIGLLSLPGQAQTNAAEPAASNATGSDQRPPAPEIANGKATQNWLSAEDGGKQASKYRQTLSGPAMNRVYNRYLNSFNPKDITLPAPETAASK